jgi:hypothetical protein
VDVRLDLIAPAIDEVLDGFTVYVSQVAAFVDGRHG